MLKQRTSDPRGGSSTAGPAHEARPLWLTRKRLCVTPYGTAPFSGRRASGAERLPQPGLHYERPGLHRYQRGRPGARCGARGAAGAGAPRDGAREVGARSLNLGLGACAAEGPDAGPASVRAHPSRRRRPRTLGGQGTGSVCSVRVWPAGATLSVWMWAFRGHRRR